MTPGELRKMHAGYMWRMTHPAPEVVWFASLMLNRLGSEVPWTPETLLGMKPRNG